MMHKFSSQWIQTILCIVFALSISACGKPSAKLERLAVDDVILAFGDSLTYGTGAAQSEAYPQQLAALINRQVINAGIPGEISAEGHMRLPGLLQEHQPKLVILCHGGNDILRRISKHETINNLEGMIRNIKATGAEVLLLAVPEPGLLLSPATFYADIAKRSGVLLLSDLIADTLQYPNLKSDPIHPNTKGYAKIASEIAKALKETGAIH